MAMVRIDAVPIVVRSAELVSALSGFPLYSVCIADKNPYPVSTNALALLVYLLVACCAHLWYCLPIHRCGREDCAGSVVPYQSGWGWGTFLFRESCVALYSGSLNSRFRC
jgi:hypothetical protein